MQSCRQQTSIPNRAASRNEKMGLLVNRWSMAARGLLSVACLLPFAATAQSVDLNWQKLGAGTSNDYASSQSFSLKSEYQALLFDVEHRRYHTDSGNIGFTHMNPGVQYLASLNEDWHLWPTFRVRIGFSNNINSSAFTYNPQLALIRNRTNGTAWVAGVGSLVHDAKSVIYPVIGVVFTDSYNGRWSGNITIPEAEVSYQLTDSWSIDAGLKWQTRFFANQISSVRPMATLYQQDIIPSVGARYQLTESVSFSAKATYTLQRRIRLYNQQGQLLETFKPNNEAGVLLGFHWAL